MAHIIARDGSIEDAAFHEAERLEPARQRLQAFANLSAMVLNEMRLSGSAEVEVTIDDLRDSEPTPAEFEATWDRFAGSIRPEWRPAFATALINVVDRSWSQRAEKPWGLSYEDQIAQLDAAGIA